MPSRSLRGFDMPLTLVTFRRYFLRLSASSPHAIDKCKISSLLLDAFRPYSRKSKYTHRNDNCQQRPNFASGNWVSPPVIPTSLWMYCKKRFSCSELLFSISCCLSVYKLFYFWCNEQMKKIYWCFTCHCCFDAWGSCE